MNTTEAQFSIKPESAALSPRVELLLDRVFGAERREKASYLFREGVAPVQALSWAAFDHNKKLVGSIRYWPIQVGETGHPALLLGPLAITPQLASSAAVPVHVSRWMDPLHRNCWPNSHSRSSLPAATASSSSSQAALLSRLWKSISFSTGRLISNLSPWD